MAPTDLKIKTAKPKRPTVQDIQLLGLFVIVNPRGRLIGNRKSCLSLWSSAFSVTGSNPKKRNML